MKKINFLLLAMISGFMTVAQTDGLVVRSEPGGFFADGYLLYGRDSTSCRIWYSPGQFNYEDTLNIWINDGSQKILLNKNDNLVGFGITQPGYIMHFGKIRLKGLKSTIYSFAKKLVTGALELYELPVTLTSKDPESYKLIQQTFSDYYLSRTDGEKFSYPQFIPQLKKKKIMVFMPGYPGLNGLSQDTLKPEEAVVLVQQYNRWFESTN